jgi:hypothetical protein
MRKELIIDLFRKFEEACYLYNGIELIAIVRQRGR